MTGVGRTANGAKLSIRVNSKTELFTGETVAKPPLHVDAFVSNASNKNGFLYIDAIETIASTGFATASGMNGKTKVFGAFYPADAEDSTVSGCDSVVFATGIVSPLAVGVVDKP